jgi:hypothetical protein
MENASIQHIIAGQRQFFATGKTEGVAIPGEEPYTDYSLTSLTILAISMHLSKRDFPGLPLREILVYVEVPLILRRMSHGDDVQHGEHIPVPGNRGVFGRRLGTGMFKQESVYLHRYDPGPGVYGMGELR